MKRRRIRGFTLIELLVVIAVITILIAFLLPAINAARRSARRSQCIANMKQWTVGMDHYHETHGMFPRGRQPYNGFSARAALLPHVEQQDLFNAINFSWPYAHVSNETVVQASGGIFLCPADGTQGIEGIYGASNYFFNAGSGLRPDGSAFPEDVARISGTETAIIQPGVVRGPVGPDGVSWSGEGMERGPKNAQVRRSAIRDGLGNTIAVSESVIGGPSNADDALLRVAVVDPTALAANPWEQRLTDALCDAAIDLGTRGGRWVAGDYYYGVYNHFYPPNHERRDCVSPLGLSDLNMTRPPFPVPFTLDAAMDPYFDPDPPNNNPYYFLGRMSARSYHSGLVVVSFLDGHTRTVTDEVDIDIWRALSTREGREIIPSDF